MTFLEIARLIFFSSPNRIHNHAFCHQQSSLNKKIESPSRTNAATKWTQHPFRKKDILVVSLDIEHHPHVLKRYVHEHLAYVHIFHWYFLWEKDSSDFHKTKVVVILLALSLYNSSGFVWSLVDDISKGKHIFCIAEHFNLKLLYLLWQTFDCLAASSANRRTQNNNIYRFSMSARICWQINNARLLRLYFLHYGDILCYVTSSFCQYQHLKFLVNVNQFKNVLECPLKACDSQFS